MNESLRDSATPEVVSPTRAAAHTPQPETGAVTAGAMLKSAREGAGLHIAALAASLKVPVRKLEALEANRWEELTDATFSRALASSMARHLKLDPAEVLAALPAGKPVPLVISGGLGRAAPANGSGPVFPSATLRWVVAILLLAAGGLYLAPQLLPTATDDLLPALTPLGGTATDQPLAGPASLVTTAPSEGPAASTSESTAAVLPGSAVVASEVSPAASGSPVGDSAVASAAPVTVAVSPNTAVAGKVLMTLQAKGDTWLEVRDDTGRLRVQRLVKTGEQMSFEEGTAYSVVVGNAAATEVEVRGKALDLLAMTKNNVARFEVK